LKIRFQFYFDRIGIPKFLASYDAPDSRSERLWIVALGGANLNRSKGPHSE
jgi:hypothetical protein